MITDEHVGVWDSALQTSTERQNMLPTCFLLAITSEPTHHPCEPLGYCHECQDRCSTVELQCNPSGAEGATMVGGSTVVLPY
jgi:hypothetical protein